MFHRFFAIVLSFLLWHSEGLSAQSVVELEAQLDTTQLAGARYELFIKLARSWIVDDLAKAESYARQALSFAKKQQGRVKEAESALLCGEILKRKDRLQEAMLLFIEAREAAVAGGLTESVLKSVEFLQALAVELGDYQSAYKWSNERSDLLQNRARQNAEAETKTYQTAKKELEDQKKRETYLWLGTLAGLIFTLSIFYYLRQRSNRRMRGELSEKNALIEEKRRRSEQLLLNILPKAVAAELTVRNKVLARRYEKATVMFVDFVGFTLAAERLEPEALVAELDYCFSQFDSIIGRFRIEKIKTVGDAYICASGLSDHNEHPADMIRAAMEMQSFLQKLNADRNKEDQPRFEARIGIHFGPVVAGVVGAKKFAYDIWGDTVNTAARLEEGGEPGKINISESTWERVRDEFVCTYRGKIPAKNKGEIAMYFVEPI